MFNRLAHKNADRFVFGYLKPVALHVDIPPQPIMDALPRPLVDQLYQFALALEVRTDWLDKQELRFEPFDVWKLELQRVVHFGLLACSRLRCSRDAFVALRGGRIADREQRLNVRVTPHSKLHFFTLNQCITSRCGGFFAFTGQPSLSSQNRWTIPTPIDVVLAPG
ncbi:hypothetical protein [Burkholderia metallica]|uniref:hypothetical protein n=1 Tax=Burkholderia metallica TaxID=488729 RepID=UPI00131B66F1|nr:hypothetical protein [Burkholderia metallica]